MTGIFRSNNPLNTFLLFVYGILLKFGWLLHPQVPVVHKSDGFLFYQLVHFLAPYFNAYPKGYFIIVYLLLFTQAISFNQVIISRRMMQKNNYLPAMCYLLVTSFFSSWNVLSAPLIINTFLIWIWAKISNLNLNQHPKSTLFNIGIAIGLTSFFYLPSFAIIVLVLLSLMITRPLKIAEWLITLLGVFIPWYFLASFLFMNNSVYSFRLSGMGVSTVQSFSFTPLLTGVIIFIFLMIIVGLSFMRSFMSKQVLQVRKIWVLLLLYFLVSLGIPFIMMNLDISYWLLALIPASAFIGCALYYPRIKWIPAVLQWIMVAFCLYMEYFAK